MEKGDVEKYLIIVLVFAGLAAIVLVLRPSPTGYVIQEVGVDLNETECADAQGWWYNYSGIEYGCYDLNAANESECDDLSAFWWSGACNAEEECVPECLDKECGDDGCGGTCAPGCEGEQTCDEGVCICIQDSDCVNLNGECGYGICNITTSTCEQAFNSSTDICREAPGECDVEEFCTSTSVTCPEDISKADGTECSAGTCQSGSCCEPETDAEFCSRLGDECGDLSAADNCGDSRTVNCGDCDSGYECLSGTCEEEEEEEESSSSSSETTREEGKNLELSGQDKVLISAGSSEEAELHVVNVGKYQLNCEIEGDWISSEEKIEQLNKGEEVYIKYKVSVPTGTSAGDYSKELIVECTGGISEFKIIEVTVVAGEGSITGEVIGEEAGARPGITGLVIGEGRGRVIAYVVFLLVLVCAVVLVWKRHAQIRGLDDLLFRGKEWFSTKFHKGK